MTGYLNMYLDDVIDISNATNIKGKHDGFHEQIASSKGVLKSEVVPATYCAWLSYNVNSQLQRFGVRNGGAQDASLLNEKWESFALAPVDSEYQTEGEGREVLSCFLLGQRLCHAEWVC